MIVYDGKGGYVGWPDDPIDRMSSWLPGPDTKVYEVTDWYPSPDCIAGMISENP